MTTIWMKVGTISTALGVLIGLILLIFTIIPPDEIFNAEAEIKNPYISLQKTKNVYFAEIVDSTYLDITSNQPDTIIMFSCPSRLYYGESISLSLNVDGVHENRKIKVFLVDTNNIIRYADHKSAEFINRDLKNKNLSDSDSIRIDIKKNIPIQFQIPSSSSRISEGTWILNIIIFNENDETSLVAVKELDISEKKQTTNFLKFSSSISPIIAILALILALIILVYVLYVYKYKLGL